MSIRNDPYSIEMLLIEYMLILREQTAHQSSVIQTFVESNRRNFENHKANIRVWGASRRPRLLGKPSDFRFNGNPS